MPVASGIAVAGIFILVGGTLAIVLAVLAHSIKMRLIGRLKYKREFSVRDAVEGEEIYITEELRNPTFLPLFFIDIASYINGNLRVEGHPRGEGMQLVISRFHVPPFSKVTRRHKVKCLRRGHYRMNSAAVLHKRKTLEYEKSFSFDSDVYVFPKAEEYEERSRAQNLLRGDVRSDCMHVFDPFSVVGIRDYTYGDPFNTINFKATAKSAYLGPGCIKVNRLDHNSDRIFMIFLNFQVPAGTDPDQYKKTMERSIAVSAYFIQKAISRGHRIGFAANCPSENGKNRILFPVSGGKSASKEMMRALASMQVSHSSSFVSLIEDAMRRDLSTAEIFIISPCMNESVENAISSLKKYNSVEVIEV